MLSTGVEKRFEKLLLTEKTDEFILKSRVQ